MIGAVNAEFVRKRVAELNLDDYAIYQRSGLKRGVFYKALNGKVIRTDSLIRLAIGLGLAKDEIGELILGQNKPNRAILN